jgi:exosortase
MKTLPLRARLLMFAVISVAASIAARGTLAELWAYSRVVSSASHVVIVPLISLALVWRQRHQVFAETRTGWGGLLVMTVALLLSLSSVSASPVIGSPFLLPVGALTMAWMGAFLFAFGPASFRAAGFALAFLVLTVPLPPAVLDATTAFLRRGSAEVVAALFSLSGTTYHRDGYVFALPRVSIEIADECSGIRSSLALGISALLAGHALLRSRALRIVLVLAIIPIAVIKNGVRIASLSWLANGVDSSVLEGRLHTDGGILFYLLALALLLPVLQVLRRVDAFSATVGTVRPA